MSLLPPRPTSIPGVADARWTLVTSAFSQSTGSHILVNSLGLYFIAPAALRWDFAHSISGSRKLIDSVLSGSGFLTLYLGGTFSLLVVQHIVCPLTSGGLAAAVASLTWRRIRGNTNGGSEGASGAIYSALGRSSFGLLRIFDDHRFVMFLHANTPLLSV